MVAELVDGSEEFVSIKALAQRLGMDRSNARKYVRKLGYACHHRRTPDSRGQKTMCLTRAEADEIIAIRDRNGFLSSRVVSAPDIGVFYVIQLVPELDPSRLKLGFSESLESRLTEHRTAAPTAMALRSWPCKRVWERTVMDALTSGDCRLILNEVFECDDVSRLLERGDAFFRMLPDPTNPPPLSPVSPLLAGQE